ncbi:WYL domain-containing protein [Streptomyces sp. NPDC050848]|uniref:WYL domain-containing protein n=1 Tax=Streptomyces sp. NPDC050848 TaxID=3155791 RepID=UPI0033D74D94
MKNTNRQTTTATLVDFYRALDRQHAITITYLKPGETEPTVRTVEVHELRTTSVKISKDGRVSGGGIMVVGMCRLRGAAREFHLSGILAYTVHRSGHTLPVPANTTYEPTPAAPANDAAALVYFELERDPDDADYRPRKRLAQDDTDLAA